MSLVKRMWISFILMLIPTVTSVYFINLSSRRQLEFTQQEVNGLEIIKVLSQWMILVADRKLLVMSSADVSTLRDLDDRIYILISDLRRKESLLDKIHYAAILKNQEKSNLNIQNLTDEFAVLRERTFSGEQLNQNLAEHTELIKNLHLAITLVGDYSNLILDTELPSYYSVDISVRILPMVLNTLLDSPALKAQNSFMPTQETHSKLIGAAAVLRGRDVPYLNDDILAITNNENLTDQNMLSSKEMLGTVERLKTQILEVSSRDLQQASARNYDISRYVEVRRKINTQVANGWISINQFLGSLLGQRLERLRSQFYMQLFFLGSLILVSSVLFLYNSFSVLQLVRQLHKQTDEAQKLARDLEQQMSTQLKLQKQIVSQEKLASLGTLSAGIAHEIKNPLNITLNSSKILKEIITDDLGPVWGRILEIPNFESSGNFQKDLDDCIKLCTNIETSSEKADEILNKMIDLAGNKAPVLLETDLSEFIKDTLKIAISSMTMKNSVEVSVEITGISHLKLMAFPRELSRALYNVLDNALYAVWRRSKRDEGFKGQIVVNVTEDASYAYVKISDNGIGVRPDNLEKIFDPFYTTKPPGEGTGLGLSISHDLVALHGGHISAINNANGGLTVELSLSKRLGAKTRPSSQLSSLL